MAKPTLTDKEVQSLNEKFEKAHPLEITRWAIEIFAPDVAVTSSFGAKAALMIHLSIQVDPKIRIRMVDTGFLFPETHQFMESLKAKWDLNVEIFRTKMDVEQFKKDHADVPVEDPSYCCGENKVEATQRALADLKCWLSGIRRTQSKTRADVPIIEVLGNGLVKVSPMAAWSRDEVSSYIKEHNLPLHPLVAKGYTSIGCYPCTQLPKDADDPRSGRWAGQDKTECGIHDLYKSQKPRPEDD